MLFLCMALLYIYLFFFYVLGKNDVVRTSLQQNLLMSLFYILTVSLPKTAFAIAWTPTWVQWKNSCAKSSEYKYIYIWIQVYNTDLNPSLSFRILWYTALTSTLMKITTMGNLMPFLMFVLMVLFKFLGTKNKTLQQSVQRISLPIEAAPSKLASDFLTP